MLAQNFVQGLTSLQFFYDELDCYVIYQQDKFFQKCYQDACNYFTMGLSFQHFCNFESHLSNGTEWGSTGFHSQNEIELAEIYSWCRKITLNEWYIKPSQEILYCIKEAKKQYIIIFDQIYPTVLSEIMADYLNDPVFILSFLFPATLAKREADLLEPNWKPLS
jgi:hypothetical protein